MSKISLEPNASGAGTFTLAAPNSDTNRTLNLPDESGILFSDGSGVPGSALSGNISINDATINGQLTANNNIRSLKPVFFGDTNQPMEFSPYHFVHGFDLGKPDGGVADLVTLDYSNAGDFIEQSVFIEFGARVQGGSTADSNSHSFLRIFGINRFTGSISLNGPSTTGTDSVREVFARVEKISDSLVKIQAVFSDSDRTASFCWGQIRSYVQGRRFNTGFYANDGSVNITFDHGWNSNE